MKHHLTLALCAFAATASSQDYSIPWSTSDGGGGSSSGGTFSMEGTIGQADAHSAAVGGTFAITSGYWVIGIIAVPGPLFSGFELPHEGVGETLLHLYWFHPQPPGTVLEQSFDLETWTTVREADLEVEHLVPSTQQRGFFRLRTPE